MITDAQCEVVYFSEHLATTPKYHQSFHRIIEILRRYQVEYHLLKSTKDIWCRDYMPIRVRENHFIQFRYEPSYLQNYSDLQSNPVQVLKANNLSGVYSDLNLDGGNVIRSKEKVIITERVFMENPTWEKKAIKRSLEELLEVEVIWAPALDPQNDMTGHADGYLRFVDDNTVLVNCLDKEFKYWRDGFLKMTEANKLSYIEMPWFDEKVKKRPDSAIGIYVNFLEVGKLILFPVFEIKGNRDQEALDIMHKAFPTHRIEPVNIYK